MNGQGRKSGDFRTWAEAGLAMALSEFESFDSAAMAKRDLPPRDNLPSV
jgi:hypothetical protein